MPTPASLFASIVFGTIGLAAFLYGKKKPAWSPLITGLALMIYPWFVEQTWLLYTIGCGLCAALYLFRD